MNPMNVPTKEEMAALERALSKMQAYVEAQERVVECQHKALAAMKNLTRFYEEVLCPVESEVKTA
jgi:hypothetical protein